MTSPDAVVVDNFQFDGEVLDAVRYGSGHIHDTYLVRCQGRGGRPRRYILQRINRHVFPRPELVMDNVAAVTGHLRQKVVARGGDPSRETLNLIPTADGGAFFRTDQGDYWRAYQYLCGAHTYESARSVGHAYHAAAAIGRFQRLLEDFPAHQLHDTIPGFHDTRQRYAAFVESVEHDVANRAVRASTDISFIEQREADAAVLVALGERKLLPERVTHNDTKLSNVMIDDDTGEGICLIDLDTVMRGLSLYDLGDCVRSGANLAAEDECNPSNVRLDLDVFEAIVRGYLDTVGDRLTSMELDHVPMSCKLMAYECGMRFLTDYLNGDTYFEVRRNDHNLDRARAQLMLVHDIESKLDRMAEIVGRCRTPQAHLGRVDDGA